MTTIRQQRVAELLYEELSIMIGNELDDPKLSLIQVTRVEISRDLRNAKVFVSQQQEEVSVREMLKHLRRAAPFLRSNLAERCGLRAAPELSFHYDDIPSKAARVDELLRQITGQEANFAPPKASGNLDQPASKSE